MLSSPNKKTIKNLVSKSLVIIFVIRGVGGGDLPIDIVEISTLPFADLTAIFIFHYTFTTTNYFCSHFHYQEYLTENSSAFSYISRMMFFFIKEAKIYILGMMKSAFSIDTLDSRNVPIHNYFCSHFHY
jgi:hypothetical protein